MSHVEYYVCENCGCEYPDDADMVVLFMRENTRTTCGTPARHFCDIMCLHEWIMEHADDKEFQLGIEK